MGSTFEVGQRVRSRQTCQGMQRGQEFEVVNVHVLRTFVGGFVTYTLRSSEGVELQVGNGHLLLESV